MSAGTALQSALAVQHQVVYGYGVSGAHLRGAERRLALQRLTQQQATRDELAALVDQSGLSPVPASPAYRTPFPVDDPTSAYLLLVLLEESASGAAWDVVAATDAGTAARQWSVSALGTTASAAQQWRRLAGPGTATLPSALPGQPD